MDSLISQTWDIHHFQSSLLLTNHDKGQNMMKMAAILKFKMAAIGMFEKNGTNSSFVLQVVRKPKNIGSTNVAKKNLNLHKAMY